MLRKDINIAKALYGGRYYNVKVHITFDDDGVLHITGHCKGCSGQISDMLDNDDIIPGNGITIAQVLRFKLIWERWHLNDMRAGDPVQEAAVREWRVDHPRYEYDEVCMYLAEQGLLIHDGYRYGTKWLKEEVPAEVLNFIFNTMPGEGDSFCQMSEADLLHLLATEDFNLEVI